MIQIIDLQRRHRHGDHPARRALATAPDRQSAGRFRLSPTAIYSRNTTGESPAHVDDDGWLGLARGSGLGWLLPGRPPDSPPELRRRSHAPTARLVSGGGRRESLQPVHLSPPHHFSAVAGVNGTGYYGDSGTALVAEGTGRGGETVYTLYGIYIEARTSVYSTGVSQGVPALLRQFSISVSVEHYLSGTGNTGLPIPVPTHCRI